MINPLCQLNRAALECSGKECCDWPDCHCQFNDNGQFYPDYGGKIEGTLGLFIPYRESNLGAANNGRIRLAAW